MTVIENQTFDTERALYGREDLLVRGCGFDGPADGESALKECGRIQAEHCRFNLRYPFWHDRGLQLRDCELTPACRAALWYSRDIRATGCALHGIKALRQCGGVTLDHCSIQSAEFGWSCQDVSMTNCRAEGEYFMMRARDLRFRDVTLKGKYAFQYITGALFENCVFDTKDAFWHAKDVVVRNSLVRGEYLAWYCENVTFENCRLAGTQPLCYCKGLRLINCEMIDADLAFERSEVEAQITTEVLSIKNPLKGTIRLPRAGQIIRDIPQALGRVIQQESP